jgi:hypothetical protein
MGNTQAEAVALLPKRVHGWATGGGAEKPKPHGVSAELLPTLPPLPTLASKSADAPIANLAEPEAASQTSRYTLDDLLIEYEERLSIMLASEVDPIHARRVAWRQVFEPVLGAMSATEQSKPG